MRIYTKERKRALNIHGNIIKMLLIATKSDTSSTEKRQVMKAALKSCHKN